MPSCRKVNSFTRRFSLSFFWHDGFLSISFFSFDLSVGVSSWNHIHHHQQYRYLISPEYHRCCLFLDYTRGWVFFLFFLVFVTVACICIKRLYSFIYIKMVIRTWQARILKRSLSLTFSLQFHYYCLFPIIIDGFTIFYTCLPSLFSPDLIYVQAPV